MSASNNCTMFGRMVRDPELKTSPNGKESIRFTIAVQRSYKGQDGKYGADFISCALFGPRASVVGKYFRKGSKISVGGEWRTGDYINKDGVKVYTNELYVSDFSFVDDKLPATAADAPANDAPAGFEAAGNIPEELPFS